MERIARDKIIVFTPNGFLPQDPWDGNPMQEHLCGWSVEDFRSRAYRVEGVLGWKALRGDLHAPRLALRPLADMVCELTRILYTGRRPEKDAALWAVKDLG
jgi:hypothetical protein